jgi:uncharacterized protein (TIGR00288 family)
MTDGGLGRGQYSPLTNVTSRGAHAALLVDFDNVTLGIRSDLQHQLKLILDSEIFDGKISVQRAYADWRRYPQYIVPLSEASFDLIFAPAFGSSKKNATDIRLAVDAVELVFLRPEISTYILLSGDSDFSTLVLKLKEYGKYVIGVGIRESASDLLIQNCDEYYSYSELTGFTKQGNEDRTQVDPWALVVEAVVKMKERGDVMRSDRLKQVMQELDNHFTEKDVGFNKFSKFVVEAAKRELLVVSKLENGQYEIDLGGDANIKPDVEAKLTKGGKKKAVKKTVNDKSKPLSLAVAFDHLRAVLGEKGANNGALSSETVRELLIERAGANPVFLGNRYNRLLRQAHDAELIELARDEDKGYQLRLAGEKTAKEEEPEKKVVARKKKKNASARNPKSGDKPSVGGPTRKTSSRPPRAKKKKNTGDRPAQSKSPAEGEDDPDAQEGLLKRMSAVVNKTIRGDQESEDA